MNNKTVLVIFLFACNAAAVAQTNPFIGKWTASWTGDRRSLEASLVIEQTGGTWRTLTRNKLDNCAGREAPIAIESFTPDSMTMQLKYSEVLQGCTDSKVELKRVDENTLTGTRGAYVFKVVRN